MLPLGYYITEQYHNSVWASTLYNFAYFLLLLTYCILFTCLNHAVRLSNSINKFILNLDIFMCFLEDEKQLSDPASVNVKRTFEFGRMITTMRNNDVNQLFKSSVWKFIFDCLYLLCCVKYCFYFF